MSVCNPCSGGNSFYPVNQPLFPPPVGAGSGSSSGGSSGGGTGTGGTTCPEGTFLPLAGSQFTVPAIGSVGQFNSPCATQWAIPGNAISIAPFGILEITGVSGDVISYRNQTIQPGTTIAIGQRLFQFVPADVESGVDGAQLEKVQGITGGVPTLISGLPFQTLRWIQQGSITYLVNQSGFQQYYPLSAPSLIVDNTTPTLTNPIAGSPTTTVTATYTLPGLPSPLPPNFGVALSIDLRDTVNETVFNNRFYVTHNGFELGRVHYESNMVWPTVRVTSNTLQLTFNKVAARTGCVALVYVHGYFI